eukprot:CAMPEP_0117695680 /NCGR_PEP_ID=MMETSP0804-20121206/28269_1 /TAXON_ID=1074897 /ORGANISM="Tetraselmis astigmatica, Strain CCMP880" /LENGTH=69 /DNA_ID=CAMNT_0005509769 /DNA_START=262 /DNA_END=471 /DNA_ORIENTATION=+
MMGRWLQREPLLAVRKKWPALLLFLNGLRVVATDQLEGPQVVNRAAPDRQVPDILCQEASGSVYRRGVH